LPAKVIKKYQLSKDINFLAISSIYSYAQDIIVLQNGEEVSTKVLKISTSEIEYKMFNHLDGPTRIVAKTDVFMIIYENGTREVMKSTTENKNSEPSATTDTTVIQPKEQLKAIEKPQTAQSEVKEQSPPDIDFQSWQSLRKGYDGKMSKFLQKQDIESYRIFHKGERLSSSGKGLIICGTIFTAVGIVTYVSALSTHGESHQRTDINGKVTYYTTDNSGIMAAGLIFATLGQVLTIAGIPLTSVGGGLKESGKNKFEDKYFKNKTSSLDVKLNLYPNGAGLTLTF